MKICISRTFSSKRCGRLIIKGNGWGISLTVTTKVCWGTIWRRLSKCNRLIHTYWIQNTAAAPWHLIKTRDGQWRHETELKCGGENSGTTLHSLQCLFPLTSGNIPLNDQGGRIRNLSKQSAGIIKSGGLKMLVQLCLGQHQKKHAYTSQGLLHFHLWLLLTFSVVTI